MSSAQTQHKMASLIAAATARSSEDTSAKDAVNDVGKKGGSNVPSAQSGVLQPYPFFYYRDFSREKDSNPSTSSLKGANNFPTKMHRILNDPELEDIVCWLPHGRSWRILRPREFERKVIPTFFEHTKFSSFIRQANGWGFRRVIQGRDRGSYYHEMFLRGMPHLCKSMKRPGKAMKITIDTDHEPDLYKISDMFPVPKSPKEKEPLATAQQSSGVPKEVLCPKPAPSAAEALDALIPAESACVKPRENISVSSSLDSPTSQAKPRIAPNGNELLVAALKACRGQVSPLGSIASTPSFLSQAYTPVLPTQPQEQGQQTMDLLRTLLSSLQAPAPAVGLPQLGTTRTGLTTSPATVMAIQQVADALRLRNALEGLGLATNGAAPVSSLSELLRR